MRRWLSKFFTFLVNVISGHRIQYYNGMAIHRHYNVMRWHTNYHGFGFQADMIVRLLDEDFHYKEVSVVTHERKKGTSSALTLRNFLSVTHTFIDLLVRRIAKSRFFSKRATRAKARCSADRSGAVSRAATIKEERPATAAGRLLWGRVGASGFPRAEALGD